MAIRYKALTELYQETQRSVTAPDQWRAFLASACRNYRLSFDEQLLVYAQRPDATAVLEIERWNRQFGRWVFQRDRWLQSLCCQLYALQAVWRGRQRV